MKHKNIEVNSPSRKIGSSHFEAGRLMVHCGWWCAIGETIVITSDKLSGSKRRKNGYVHKHSRECGPTILITKVSEVATLVTHKWHAKSVSPEERDNVLFELRKLGPTLDEHGLKAFLNWEP